MTRYTDAELKAIVDNFERRIAKLEDRIFCDEQAAAGVAEVVTELGRATKRD